MISLAKKQRGELLVALQVFPGLGKSLIYQSTACNRKVSLEKQSSAHQDSKNS
jgi:hypothetical protein